LLPVIDTPTTSTAEAVTLVASHSFGFSSREWIEVAGLLSDSYRTVAVDAPGFGQAADIGGYSMEEMATAFAQTVNELHLTRYVLVGHSMTGKVMAILASRAGARLGLAQPPEKLVLLTPTPLGREVGGEDLRQFLLAQTKTQADADRFVAERSFRPLPPHVHARAAEDYLLANRAAWEAWLNKGVYEDWITRSAPVTLPTLVIAAEHDPVWGLPVQQQLTMPHLADATITTIDSGHLVPMEAPDELAALLRDFIGP